MFDILLKLTNTNHSANFSLSFFYKRNISGYSKYSSFIHPIILHQFQFVFFINAYLSLSLIVSLSSSRLWCLVSMQLVKQQYCTGCTWERFFQQSLQSVGGPYRYLFTYHLSPMLNDCGMRAVLFYKLTHLFAYYVSYQIKYRTKKLFLFFCWNTWCDLSAESACFKGIIWS